MKCYTACVLLDDDLVKFPIYLAWTAILIDYMEAPVMIVLFYKVFKAKHNE
jgi:hypothetical protein